MTYVPLSNPGLQPLTLRKSSRAPRSMYSVTIIKGFPVPGTETRCVAASTYVHPSPTSTTSAKTARCRAKLFNLATGQLAHRSHPLSPTPPIPTPHLPSTLVLRYEKVNCP